MGEYNEIEGDLIKLALEGKFDVITHGCNCFCRMKRGIAPQMAKAFGCDNFPLEDHQYIGNHDKLGRIDYKLVDVKGKKIAVVNSYTQYRWGTEEKPFDYDAFTLCMKKINHRFSGYHIGMPMIGSHLAGGDWNRIKQIIKEQMTQCNVTVVVYKP